jgi:hypothetical protein
MAQAVEHLLCKSKALRSNPCPRIYIEGKGQEIGPQYQKAPSHEGSCRELGGVGFYYYCNTKSLKSRTC